MSKETTFNRICAWALKCGLDIKFNTNIRQAYDIEPDESRLYRKTPEVILYCANGKRLAIAGESWDNLLDRVFHERKKIFADLCMPEMEQPK